jgi:hypothetical protein
MSLISAGSISLDSTFKVPQVRKYILVLLKNLASKALKNVYIIKNRVKRRLLGLFRDKVVQYFVDICGFTIRGLILKIFGFAICVLAYLRKLRFCDNEMSPRISGFAICGL